MRKTKRTGAGRGARTVIVRLAFACLLFVLFCAPASAAATHAAKAAVSTDDAVARFQALLSRKSVGKRALKRAAADLAAAYAAHPRGATGSRAAFALARAREEIAQRSGRAPDWNAAADSYGEFLDHFPRYRVAAEALFRRGRIRLDRLGDADGASQDFRELLAKHPSSAFAAQAKPLLRRATAKTAPPPTKSPSAAKAKNADDDTPTLIAVHAKNHGKRARLVFDLDGKARYKYQQLGDTRVYIDLMDANVGPGVRPEQKYAHGLLRRVRVAERHAGGFVRIVLDFAALKDFSVQALNAPFRIVFDARATKEAAADQPVADQDAVRPKRIAPAFAKMRGGRRRSAAELVEQLGLSVRTVMIDPGHGGKDPGAQANGLNEKDVNLRMARALGRELKRRGFRVLYTRTTDVFIPLPDRTSMANSQKADLFISLHCNAYSSPTMHGLETYSLNLAKTPDEVRVAARENAGSGKNISDLQMILTDLMLTSKIKESVALAQSLQKNCVSALRRRWRVANNGNREAPFYVLMGAKMPSSLIEIGYITNATEAAHMRSDGYLKTLARGVANGVVAYKRALERYALRPSR